jgi:hypothetical protein
VLTLIAHRFTLICRFALADGVPRRALWVAVVVGTVLNLINQGDAIVAGGPINVVKMALTYIVPYCVATYGAVSYRLHAAAAARGADPAGERAHVATEVSRPVRGDRRR